MKKKFFIIVLTMFVLMLVFASCASIGMDNLPKGELIKTSYSPDKTYMINVFLVSGNATVDFSIRCEVVEVSSSKKRNIYWQYHCDNAQIKWIDNVTVSINNKELNVITDSYDWRRE